KLPYAAIAMPVEPADLPDEDDDGEDDLVLHEEQFETVAAHGEPPEGELVALSIAYRGEVVGRLLLAPRLGEGGFTPADTRLVADLARQAGAALHAAQLTADLRRSRERLVAAREEERRRLRRDLHDGLGPTLAAHAMQLEAARDLIEEQP